MVLAIKNMGGESEAAWRAVLDDLTSRGLGRPELVIVDGGKGLEAALASLWDDVLVQRCTVHKERNLLAHAPQHLHDEAEEDVLAYMSFPKEHRAKIHSTDEIDKRVFCSVGGAMVSPHGRPRGEERGGGCEPRRAA